MKKKLIFVIIIIMIFILFTFAIKIWIDINNTIPSTIVIGVDEYKIKDYITSIYKSNNKNIDHLKTFVIVKELETEVNKKNHEVIFYAWILTESYCEKDGKIEEVAKDSMPYKFTLYDTVVKQCEFSKEYSNDFSSLEHIFPENVRDKFPQEEEIKLLNREMEEQVYSYYNSNYREE